MSIQGGFSEAVIIPLRLFKQCKLFESNSTFHPNSAAAILQNPELPDDIKLKLFHQQEKIEQSAKKPKIIDYLRESAQQKLIVPSIKQETPIKQEAAIKQETDSISPQPQYFPHPPTSKDVDPVLQQDIAQVQADSATIDPTLMPATPAAKKTLLETVQQKLGSPIQTRLSPKPQKRIERFSIEPNISEWQRDMIIDSIGTGGGKNAVNRNKANRILDIIEANPRQIYIHRNNTISIDGDNFANSDIVRSLKYFYKTGVHTANIDFAPGTNELYMKLRDLGADSKDIPNTPDMFTGYGGRWETI